jgi:hypothetical protein
LHNAENFFMNVASTSLFLNLTINQLSNGHS